MLDRSLVTGIAKSIATDMRSGRLSAETQRAIGMLGAAAEHLFDLVELIAKETARKKPKDDLVSAFAFLLAHSLEQLRYGIDRKDRSAMALDERLRARLLAMGDAGEIRPPGLLLVLKQFASAKLEMGDNLRDLMQRLMEGDTEARAASERGEGDGHLAAVARELGGDPFAISGYLEESAETMPEDLRASMALTVFSEKEPAVREAALGFLLNGSQLARAKLVELITLAAPLGIVTPTMLRRMITMRNWLPETERPGLDRAISACRKKGVACAAWPDVAVRKIVASGIDGSGAQTVIAVVRDGKKNAIAGLLLKQGFGVRDAWVRRGMKDADVREMLEYVGGEVGVGPSNLDYAGVAIRHALTVNLETGTPPPFGLLDVAETIGLGDANPCALPVDELVASLCEAVTVERLMGTAVAQTLRDSFKWSDEHKVLDSWFEENVGRLVGTSPKAGEKQKAALLAGPLQAKRRRWAELCAWTAFVLKHQPRETEWEGFAIVARELLGTRPLDQIGLMHRVAYNSLEAAVVDRMLGTEYAA
jgi:hypothetical protein